MNDSTREISPLRQRMLEDMRLRKLSPQTQAGYVRSVRRLAAYLRRAPDTATVGDLRNFQLHLVDRGTSPITLNATITGLKVFFDVTLDRSELRSKVGTTPTVVTPRSVIGRRSTTNVRIRGQTSHSRASAACGGGLRLLWKMFEDDVKKRRR
jgi:integrase/recombinase XerD